MNRSRGTLNWLALAAGAAGLLASAGCTNLFVPKQKVTVDAICAPGMVKPSGKSYRLVAKKSVVSGQQAQLPVIAACINSALIGIGMYEAPPKVPSDVFIEVTYGMDTAGRVDPATRETFLQLSARDNKAKSLEATHEEELWDVRAAVAGVAGRMESAMPLLSWAAASYAGTDTHTETTIEVLQRSPQVEAVRQGALNILDGKDATTPAPKVTEAK